MKKLLILLAAVTAVACAPKNEPVALVPYPNQVEYGAGRYSVLNAQFTCDEAMDDRAFAAVALFADQLATVSGGENEATKSAVMPSEGFRFVVDPTVEKEGYRLSVTRKGVEVSASEFPGFYYAIQTIKQLLPAEVYGEAQAADKDWTMPCLAIEDAPRFGYRGMHLDVSRHFFSIEEVKRYIDIMAVHKLNRLHWHLTDDQGWRVEIKRFPKLTEVGSMRKHTVVRKDWGTYDGIPHGGYYTQDQIREVVEYAAANAIEIIPEIDLPGHMMAALAAYPELGCTGGPYEVWPRWGISDEVLCAGNDKIFDLLEGVFEELVELFPSELIHIGGDECPKTRWSTCPTCQAKIKELGLKDDDKHSAEHYLQSYVMTRIEEFLAEKGRRVVGWDEILEGQIGPNATVMSWRGNEGGIEAAKLGHDVIMVPSSYFYFDYYQSADKEAEPFGIGGFLPVDRVYSYELPEELTEEEAKHILGVQANLWTEYIADADHLYYMLLPRLAALSEVQWCNKEVREWDRFISNFRMHEIYDVMGYNYAKHIFGITAETETNIESRSITATLSTIGGVPIYYTLDGSEPTTESAVYTEPLEIDEQCTLTAAVFREGIDVANCVVPILFNKATARPATLNSNPHAKYLFEGAKTLVDGRVGGPDFGGGPWIGYLFEDMDITIDMEGSESYSKVMLTALAQKAPWVFLPMSMTVLTSDDNENFTEVGHLDIEPQAKGEPDGIFKFAIDIEPTTARYLRVKAATLDPVSKWHNGGGGKGFLFAGEIEVE